MKIITLNTWGGRVRDPFLDFIKTYKDTDIFCFQEIYDNAEEAMKDHYPQVSFDLFKDLKTLLPEHNGFFRPVLQGIYGVATFIKKDFSIIEEGEIFIHKNEQGRDIDGHHSRNLQWIKFNQDEKIFTIVNVHGLWNGQGKTDTPARLAQSNVIREFIDSVDDPKIVCGDFNLNPDTESLKILEKDMQNLIKDYSVSSTRTTLYDKPGKYADYVFISKNIPVNDFKILPEEVSDHAALYLEI